MKLTLSAFFISLFISSVQAQYVIEWQKCFGGTQNDRITCMRQTTDSGYILCGSSESIDGDVTGNHGKHDYWIVKVDQMGTIQWKQAYGGTWFDMAYDIQQTTDGGYIISGYGGSTDGDVIGNHGFGDYWVLKINSTGGIQWQKSFGGSDDEDECRVQQTTDGGYILCGISSSNDGDVTGNHGGGDYWIVKISNNGAIEWQKCLGGSENDSPSAIQLTKDGGYVIAGCSFSNNGDVSGNHGFNDFWIVKLNSGGDLQWQKSLGGSQYECAMSIQLANDSGYVVCGFTESNDGDVNDGPVGSKNDAWIIKLDNAGEIEWQKCIGGSDDDVGYCIEQTNDSGYIVSGITYSNDGDVSGNHGLLDTWIVKLSGNGTIEWQECFGGSYNEAGHSVLQLSDDEYVVAGVASSNDGDVSGNHGYLDYWIFKLASSMGNEEIMEKNIKLYPNPASQNLIVSSVTDNINDLFITINNMLGQTVFNNEFKNPQSEIDLDVSTLSPGLYFLHLQTEHGRVVKKFVKE